MIHELFLLLSFLLYQLLLAGDIDSFMNSVDLVLDVLLCDGLNGVEDDLVLQLNLTLKLKHLKLDLLDALFKLAGKGLYCGGLMLGRGDVEDKLFLLKVLLDALETLEHYGLVGRGA
jgi:hypothetical protein